MNNRRCDNCIHYNRCPKPNNMGCDGHEFYVDDRPSIETIKKLEEHREFIADILGEGIPRLREALSHAIETLKNLSKEEFNNDYERVNDSDLEELSRQIRDGYTSGTIDNSRGKRIYWKINVNVFGKEWKEEGAI